MKQQIQITILLLSFSFNSLSSSLAQSPEWTDMSDHIPTSVSNANLTDVAATGESVWISCSNLKGVFCSSDDGNTFIFKDLGVGIQGLYRFSDGIRGWCVGGAYGFKTEDGGESWNPVFIGSTLLSMTFANDMVGYATGLGSVYRTDDGGTTWVKKSDIFNLNNRDVTDAAFPDPLNPLVGYVSVANEISTIFKTTNGGDTWEYVTLSSVTSSVNDLEFNSPVFGWAVGGESNIFRFENNSWTLHNTPLSVSLNSITASPDFDDCWSVGNSGTILHYTPSSGWLQEATGLTNEYLAGVDAVNSSTVYAVGMNKTFLKYMVVNDMPENPKSKIRISPTPASDHIQIEWTGCSVLKIEMTDLSGKVVLKTESGCADKFIHIPLKCLPSGVYLVEMVCDHQMIVKKIIKL